MKIDGYELKPTVNLHAGIDATPDGGYALRILRRYRQDAYTRWADSTDEDRPVTNLLLVAMNQMQEKRVAELDKAIAALERAIREDAGVRKLEPTKLVNGVLSPEDWHLNQCPYNKAIGCALGGAPCVLPKEARWGRVQPSAFETCEHRVLKDD